MHAGQTDQQIERFSVATNTQWHPPILGQRSQDILEHVGGLNLAIGQGQDFVTVSQAATISIAGAQNVAYQHLARGVGRHSSTKRGVIYQPTTSEHTHKVLELISADRITDSDVDPSSFFKRAPTIDANHFACQIE